MTLVQQQPKSIKIGTTDVKKVTVWRGSTRLPSAYQEVEYIESSGTQYFIVGTSFKTSYKSVIDFQMTVIGGDYVPLGCNNDSPFYRYGIDAWGNSFKIISGGSSRTSTISEDTNRHTITIDKSSATVDGINYNVSYTNATIPRGIGVFGYNQQAEGVGFKSSAKLYKLDIYDENGTHIYDLVPCYRKSDTEIGMYDLINDVFYTNEGTGTFTKGNDVGGLQEIQVRPSEIWSFSYDFTTGSAGDLQSKGWTVPSGSIINSNGYYNQSRNRRLITYSSAELTSALQNAKSMTMTLTWYSTGESQRVWGIKHTGGQETIFYGDCVTAAVGNQALFSGESLVKTDGDVYGSTGTYTTTISADLVNKTWEYKGNPSDQTGVLTNTAINNFKAGGNLQVYADAGNGQTIYIKNVSIIIY